MGDDKQQQQQHRAIIVHSWFTRTRDKVETTTLLPESKQPTKYRNGMAATTERECPAYDAVQGGREKTGPQQKEEDVAARRDVLRLFGHGEASNLGAAAFLADVAASGDGGGGGTSWAAHGLRGREGGGRYVRPPTGAKGASQTVWIVTIEVCK